MCNIIVDTNGKFVFVFVVKYSDDIARGRIFGTKSVTAAYNLNTVKLCAF